jgi:hypothetical protein
MSDERLVARDTRTLPFLWISRALIDTTLAKMPRNRRQRALRSYTARFSRKGGKRVCLPNEYTLIDLGAPKKTPI